MGDLCGLIWGVEDLLVVIGVVISCEFDGCYIVLYEIVWFLMLFVVYVVGVVVIEMVWFGIVDLEGFVVYVVWGSWDGFIGMMVIYLN